MTKQLTEGARLLAIALKKHGPAESARRTRLSEAAVRHIAIGRRVPSPRTRAALQAAYDIAPDAFDRPARASKASKARAPDRAPSRPPPATSDVAPDADVHTSAEPTTPAAAAGPPRLPNLRTATAEELQEHVVARFHALEAEAQDFAPRDRIALVNGLTQAIAALARLRGEAAVLSESRVLRSAALKRIEARLVEVLTKHPETLEEVGAALAELGREGAK